MLVQLVSLGMNAHLVVRKHSSTAMIWGRQTTEGTKIPKLKKSPSCATKLLASY